MDTEINQDLSRFKAPKKRVLFIITQSEMGGAQRFLYNFLNQTDQDSYDYGVAVGADGDNELTEKLESIKINTFKLESLKREIDPLNDISAVFEISKLVNKTSPDVLFLLSSKAGFIGSLAVRFLVNKKPKVIYRIGGWTFNDPWPKYKKNFWIFLERLSAGWKDVIIVNNKNDLVQAQSLGIKPKTNILLVHNGIDIYKTDFLNPDEARKELSEIIKQRTNKTIDGNLIIGTISNFYKTKGLEFFIDSARYFSEINNAIFIIIGEGQERKSLELLIKKYGLENKVILTGKIEEAQRLLPAFNVFVLSSIKEGFPWSILEALGAKIPVVATSVGGVPDIIKDGENGFLVDPGKSEQIAKKVKEIINNPYLQKEFSIKGHQTVLFNFSSEKMISKTKEIIGS